MMTRINIGLMEDCLNCHGHEIYEDKRIFKVNEDQNKLWQKQVYI
jgi:hypothetical protein